MRYSNTSDSGPSTSDEKDSEASTTKVSSLHDRAHLVSNFSLLVYLSNYLAGSIGLSISIARELSF